MSKITKFYFGDARYILEDDDGNELLLGVDYQNNSFHIDGETASNLKEKIVSFAQDLLKRKHGVNFADKIKVY